MPLRVINASDAVAPLDISIHGDTTGFDRHVVLSAYSEKVFVGAIKSSDTDYEFSVDVAVDDTTVLSERRRQTYPKEFVLVIKSPAEAVFFDSNYVEVDA